MYKITDMQFDYTIPILVSEDGVLIIIIHTQQTWL